MPSSAAPSVIESKFEKGDIVIHIPVTDNFWEVVEWVDKNSKSPVSIKTIKASQQDGKWVESTSGTDQMFFAFKDSDDALFFRIKYVNR